MSDGQLSSIPFQRKLDMQLTKSKRSISIDMLKILLLINFLSRFKVIALFANGYASSALPPLIGPVVMLVMTRKVT